MSMNVGGVAKKGGSDTAEISHASGSNFPRSQPLNGQRGFKLSHAAFSESTETGSSVFELAVRSPLRVTLSAWAKSRKCRVE